MLSDQSVVDEPESIAVLLARKGVEPARVYEFRDAILERRAARTAVDTARAELNTQRSTAREAAAGNDAAAHEIREHLRSLKARVAELENAYRDIDACYHDLSLVLPNVPDANAPVGDDETSNVVLRYERNIVAPPMTLPHWEIAERQGWLDQDRASRMSGSGFSILRGDGARLLRALVQFGLDINRVRYEEVVVPHMVKGPTMVGTGHLPKFADDAYTTFDDMWLIPTGEVPLTAMHQDEILDAADLPLRYMTATSCFRREAGSAGKDTRGMLRIHEFHKVELMIYCSPEAVDTEYEALLADAEESIQLLELPYRVVDLCTGDLTFSSSRILDIEVYSPGVGTWLEVASVGNFTDFQTRRGRTRMRTPTGNINPITLNGSAMATPRVWAALLENGLQEDGTVRLPAALHSYFGRESIGTPLFA